MTQITTAFNADVRDLGGANEFHFIGIETINASLQDYIDKTLVKICEGNIVADLTLVKKRLAEFLASKKDSTIEMGAIAEFFIHLYLNAIGFAPQFLFFNLEEGSIKKGFDGYYSYSNAQWIVESKSGSISTKGISHPKKIKESYDDLKDKLSGGGANNPWQNAYNHAAHIDVGATRTLRDLIKSFSNEYINKKYHEIKDFNIVPGSTLFLDGNWITTDINVLEIEVKNLVVTLEFQNIKIICITKKTLDLFRAYLKN